MIPISINLSLGIGALSYADQFNITAVADRDTCPDVNTFATEVRNTLDALTTSTAARSMAAMGGSQL